MNKKLLFFIFALALLLSSCVSNAEFNEKLFNVGYTDFVINIDPTEEYESEESTEQETEVEETKSGRELIVIDPFEYFTTEEETTEPEIDPNSLFVVSDLDEDRYTLDCVYVREYPWLGSNVHTSLSKHTLIHVYGVVCYENMSWYLIYYDGCPRYVCSQYVSSSNFYENEINQNLYVIADVLNVREVPDGTVMSKLYRDNYVNVIAKTNNGWYKLASGGYVNGSYLSETKTIWYKPNAQYEADPAAYIWNYLYPRINNPYIVAALMGNMAAESGLTSTNVQATCKAYYWEKDFANPLGLGNVGWSSANKYINTEGLNSRTFINTYLTRKFDDGTYDFIYFGPSSQQFGYGLIQWTSARRKSEFYNYAHDRFKSVGDIDTQLDFILYELNNTYYRSCGTLLNDTNGFGTGLMDDTNPVWIITRYYESPSNVESAFQSRWELAKHYYNLYYNK